MNDSNGPDIQMWARLHHYHIDPFALKRFSEFLNEVQLEDQEDRRNLLHDVFVILKRICAKDRIIDNGKMNDAINLQVAKMGSISLDVKRKPSVLVIPLANVPRVRVNEFSDELRVYPPDTTCAHKGRLEALRHRYLLARRRSLRSEVYCRDIHQSSGSGDGGTPLLSTSGLEGIPTSSIVAVLGLLTRRADMYFLEDLNGRIPLRWEYDSLASLQAHSFILEGFIIIATGSWSDEVFRVIRANLPPAERRELTIKDAGTSTDVFGMAPTDKVTAWDAEQQAVQSVIVFLAHIHLDKSETVQHLQKFFLTMEERSEHELEDTTFVFIGGFCSMPLNWGNGDSAVDPSFAVEEDRSYHLKSLLNLLGECIATNAPTAASHSNFILIPGPQDITLLSGLLPQPPIPTSFISGLKKKLKQLSVASNPCRLRFFTQEIVVCRRDYLRTFQRAERQCWGSLSGGYERSKSFSSSSAVEEESKPEDPPEKKRSHTLEFERVAKTILDEAHLCPDLLNGGVAWKLDDALSLPALPHLLLVCDAVEQWECFYKDVHVVNPGSFSASGTFLWYTPADRECSIGQIS